MSVQLNATIEVVRSDAKLKNDVTGSSGSNCHSINFARLVTCKGSMSYLGGTLRGLMDSLNLHQAAMYRSVSANYDKHIAEFSQICRQISESRSM
jgi:hypothetical protein